MQLVVAATARQQHAQGATRNKLLAATQRLNGRVSTALGQGAMLHLVGVMLAVLKVQTVDLQVEGVVAATDHQLLVELLLAGQWVGLQLRRVELLPVVATTLHQLTIDFLGDLEGVTGHQVRVDVLTTVWKTNPFIFCVT